MHILVVTDQHPESLGGVQVALRLQRRSLERAGHTVTIAAPALHRPGYVPNPGDARAYLDLPSRPITRDREYGMTWPGKRSDRALDRGLAERELAGGPPVDLVHVQGDFWGAMIGIRAARRLGVPLVLTMHNNVDEGTRAVTSLAPVAFVALRAWSRLAVGPVRRAGHTGGRARGAWRYLAGLAAEADLVTAPSAHFAATLERHGVTERVAVTQGGVDDAVISEVLERPRSARTRPRLVWLGRMSNEKRILEFVAALGESGVDADVTLHGAGLLLSKVTRSISSLGLADRVHVAGPVPYAEALAAMREADALVQTSIGFETQGLTPFEAAALGTPTIFSDPHIASDLGVEPAWLARDGSVAALAEVLREAVAALAASPSGLRVPEAAGASLLQSTRSAEMVALYERVLRGQGPGGSGMRPSGVSA